MEGSGKAINSEPPQVKKISGSANHFVLIYFISNPKYMYELLSF
jgi:hypothetical protein